MGMKEDLDRALTLLHGAYSALSGLKRSGLPLDPDWPKAADDSYEEVGEFLYPSSGRTPQERFDQPHVGTRYLMIDHGQRIWMTAHDCAIALNMPIADGGRAVDIFDSGAERLLTEDEKRYISNLSDEHSGNK